MKDALYFDNGRCDETYFPLKELNYIYKLPSATFKTLEIQLYCYSKGEAFCIMKVLIPTDKDFNYLECKKIFEDNQNLLEDNEKFDDVIRNTFFYSFFVSDSRCNANGNDEFLLACTTQGGKHIGCIYYYEIDNKLYDTVNNFAKGCKFLFNGMHAVALTESAAAHEGIVPFKTFKTLGNLPKIIDGIKMKYLKIPLPLNRLFKTVFSLGQYLILT